MNARSYLRLGALLLITLTHAAACGSSVDGGGSPGAGGAGGAPSGGEGGAGGGAGGGGGGGLVQCWGGGSPVFPTFDKTCATKADCVIKLHMTDCCGSLSAIGVSASAGPAFDAAEAECEAMYPGCGCAGGPTLAEDGKSLTDPAQMVQVDCLAGACSTFIQ